MAQEPPGRRHAGRVRTFVKRMLNPCATSGTFSAKWRRVVSAQRLIEVLDLPEDETAARGCRTCAAICRSTT